MKRMTYGSFTCWIIIHLLLLLLVKCSSTTTSIPKVARFNILIEGYVYCTQSNIYNYSTAAGNYQTTLLLADATPLTGAGVNLNCSSLNQTSLIQNATTKERGYFSILTPKPMGYAEFEGCKVYLSSSPDEKCNIPTDLNSGRDGGAVLQLNDEVINITVGPFAFQSSATKKTTTTTYNLKPDGDDCNPDCLDCYGGCCYCTFDSYDDCWCN